MTSLIQALSHRVPAALRELITLGRTLKKRAEDVLAYLDRPGSSNGGVNPIPASSGNTTRHRLNRGGDRRLKRALHMAIVTRMRMDPLTRAYVERRTAEGRSIREIRRCLARYLARQIYRQLHAATQASPRHALTDIG